MRNEQNIPSTSGSEEKESLSGEFVGGCRSFNNSDCFFFFISAFSLFNFPKGNGTIGSQPMAFPLVCFFSSLVHARKKREDVTNVLMYLLESKKSDRPS